MIPSDTIAVNGEVGKIRRGNLGKLRKNKTEEDEGRGLKDSKDDLKSHLETLFYVSLKYR